MSIKKKIKGILSRVTVIIAVAVVFLAVNVMNVKAADPDYLTFTALEDNSSVTVDFTSCGSDGWHYKINNGETENKSASDHHVTIDLSHKDDRVQLWADHMTTNINSFSMDGKIKASGSVTSLTDENGSDPDVTLSNYCYSYMFVNCSSLVDASELKLPATTLEENCYYYMFSGCSNLTKAPELPATTLAQSCYEGMFYGCSNLTKAPELPANNLAQNCYSRMFSGCSNLTKAPVLPANDLARSCYEGMFYGCSSLTKAPELPATTLAYCCYSNMFYGCSSLTKTPELTATTLNERCYMGMFLGCTGLSSLPELPATILPDNCYQEMFRNCTGLQMWYEETGEFTKPWIISATGAEHAVDNMFAGCIGEKFHLDADGTKIAPDLNTTYYLKAPAPTPAPQNNSSDDEADDDKTESKYKDPDTNKSEVPYETVSILNSEDKSFLQDMKVYPVDTRTKSNQEFLAQYYAKKLGKKVRIFFTKSIYPRNPLAKDQLGKKMIFKWKNLEKKAQPIYAVCYNETDKTYYLSGTLDANGTAVFNDFIVRDATNITLFVLE